MNLNNFATPISSGHVECNVQRTVPKSLVYGLNEVFFDTVAKQHKALAEEGVIIIKRAKFIFVLYDGQTTSYQNK